LYLEPKEEGNNEFLSAKFATVWNYSVRQWFHKHAQVKYEMRALSTKWRYEKLAAVICVSPTAQNLVISRSCFAEDGKEITDF